MRLGDVDDDGVQQATVVRHVVTVVGCRVEAVTQVGDGVDPTDRSGLKDVKRLLGIGTAEANLAVIPYIDQIEGMHRTGAARSWAGAGVTLLQEKHHAGVGGRR